MSKHKYSPSDLEMSIEITEEIFCDNCDKVDSIYCYYDSEGYFFKKGWRVTRSGKTYCPKCAKKKLKNP